MPRPFKSELVINEQININSLKAFNVGFDQTKFRLIPLVEVIRRVIPEFALGFHCGENIPLNEIVDILKEAADTVFDTDKYKRRGEFGEIILHLLLRDFCNTIPLISKIYFKDSRNFAVHGFDGVQVTINGNDKKLWLGESKLYKDGKAGIKELLKDLVRHINADYIRSEFQLLKRKLPNNVPEIEYWRSLMDQHQKLDELFSKIVIPMVCTYNSSLFKNHQEASTVYFKEFDKECIGLHTEFMEGKKDLIDCNIDVLLLLLPIENKDELNTELFQRLKNMQKI